MYVLTERDKKIQAKLDAIEAEMKRIGYWRDDPPDFEASNNYIKAPYFELWLQCVFLPNARQATHTGRYPEQSQIGLIALRQYDYHSYIEKAQPLLKLLCEFDKLVEGR